MKHDIMKHVRRLGADIICSFVSDKETKKRIYQRVSEFSIFDIPMVRKFQKTPVRKKSVLLVETNACHGEVISAYFRYFQDLGYNVDIIMHDFVYKEKHFTRHDVSKLNIYHCHQTAMRKMFRSKKMDDYLAIFIMTPTNTGNTQSVLTFFPELDRFTNLYVIAHNLPDIDNKYTGFDKSHVFGLGRRLNKFPATNPHLFGNVHKNHKKHKITTFITVGRIDPQIKNHTMLISAIEKLVKKGYKFKVIVIGEGKMPNVSDKIKPFIIATGRQIAESMYQYMEQSDFFLTLWDKKDPTHDKYRTNLISGSPQLIYGFNKIPIIQKEFADFYDFNKTNAIVYEDDGLTDAMEQAILMNDNQYAKLYKGLDKLSQEVYNESKENIAKALRKLEK